MAQDTGSTPLWRSLANSAAAATIAETTTLPLDTAKVHMPYRCLLPGICASAESPALHATSISETLFLSYAS